MSGSEESPLDQVRAVAEECRAKIADATGDALTTVRTEVLGRNGRIAGLMELLKSAPREMKRELGQTLNQVKQELSALFDRRVEEAGGLSQPGVKAEDTTLPGRSRVPGALHPLSKIERQVVRVFETLGFEVTEGYEIEDEFHNFQALNIPDDHPARDEKENFYLENSPFLLRSQTSTIQIRTMEGKAPPLRICAPGRVFRPDTVDATHHYMFHQVEGLAVDRNITMRDLKSTLLLFFRTLYGDDVQVRLRPSFFPFTEPSAEVDVYFPNRGWIEIGGCGMVDPNVFEAVGIDPEEWTGFAFGLGLERIAMRQFAVPDIRYFTDNDARFLRQLD